MHAIIIKLEIWDTKRWFKLAKGAWNTQPIPCLAGDWCRDWQQLPPWRWTPTPPSMKGRRLHYPNGGVRMLPLFWIRYTCPGLQRKKKVYKIMSYEHFVLWILPNILHNSEHIRCLKTSNIVDIRILAHVFFIELFVFFIRNLL